MQRRVSTVAIRPPKLAQADADHLMDEVLKSELLMDNADSANRLDSGDQWRHTVDTLLNRRLEYSVMVRGGEERERGGAGEGEGRRGRGKGREGEGQERERGGAGEGRGRGEG